MKQISMNLSRVTVVSRKVWWTLGRAELGPPALLGDPH